MDIFANQNAMKYLFLMSLLRILSAMRGDELKPVVKEYKEGYIIEIKSAKDDTFAVVEFTKKGDS